MIEVIAALALLATLAVAMLLSRARLVEQNTRALQKLEAIRVADLLLAEWWAGSPTDIPINDQGMIEGQDGWYWETRVIDHSRLRPFEAQVVRLVIVDRASVGSPTQLTAIDLVLPGSESP